MTYQQVQEFTSLQGDPGQPLIGVMTEEQGHEVVRYFTEELAADRVMVEDTTQAGLALAGAWSDLAWEELEQGLRPHSTRITANATTFCMRQYLLDSAPLAGYLHGRQSFVDLMIPLIREHQAATSILVSLRR